MIVIILLFTDFFLLGFVFFFYVRKSLRERARLQGAANKSNELQQKIYQIQVLQEVGERIGYSLDVTKIVEIITSSIGTLMDYDTVSFVLFGKPEETVWRCHVYHSVSHQFIAQVKEKMQAATMAVCHQEVSFAAMDERITGTILDNNMSTSVQSFVNVPVVISDQLLGMITVASSKPALYGQDEAAVLYTITNQAATAVTRLERVLQNEKGKLLGIISAMTDGVFMVDRQNQLLISNPAVVDILQFPVGKTVTMFDIIDALAGKVDLRTKVEESLAKHIPIVVPEVYLKDKAIEITVTPVLDELGQLRGAAVILHDVTSEKSLEKLRQEFTAMMVHELRAPLTAVRWSSEGLIKNLNNKDAELDVARVRDSITTIDTSAGNMLDMVNDLLDVAKIEAGKFELNVQEYDLERIIADQIKTFLPQMEGHHLSLNFISPGIVKVKCDRVRIAQVLNNLMSNAIKYTDSGQIDVNLSLEKNQSRIVVSIKDTGIGVSHEDLNVLFSKFKQLKGIDHTRKGTGLGLVVSKGIIEAHGGQIWAESAGENLGSTFYFSLPL